MFLAYSKIEDTILNLIQTEIKYIPESRLDKIAPKKIVSETSEVFYTKP